MTGVTGKTSKNDEMLLYALCARGTRPDIQTENDASGAKLKTMGPPRQSHIMWDRGGDEAKAWWKSEVGTMEVEGENEDDDSLQEEAEGQDDEEIFDETHVLRELDALETKCAENQQQLEGKEVSAKDVVPDLDVNIPDSRHKAADPVPPELIDETKRKGALPSKNSGWEVQKIRTKQKRLSAVKVGNGFLTDMLQATSSGTDSALAHTNSSRKNSLTSREERANSENPTSLEFCATFVGSEVQQVQLNDKVVSKFDLVHSMAYSQDDATADDEVKQSSKRGTNTNLSFRSMDNDGNGDALNSVFRTVSSLLIADARPKINAIANKLKGKGYENTSAYKEENIELKFMGIGNIHVMRNSHRKIFGSLETGNWRTTVQKSNWLSHVQRVLAGACRVAAKIGTNQSVLVHCSDGECRCRCRWRRFFRVAFFVSPPPREPCSFCCVGGGGQTHTPKQNT